jgi:hypothetical protein
MLVRALWLDIPTLQVDNRFLTREVEDDSGGGTGGTWTERLISESGMGGRLPMCARGVGEMISNVVVVSSAATGGVRLSTLRSGPSCSCSCSCSCFWDGTEACALPSSGTGIGCLEESELELERRDGR